MYKRLNRKGFTLIELMIVVVILGILVGIAVPIYSVVTTNAKKKTCYSNMRMISGACVQYYMTHDSYDGLVPDSGIDDLGSATLPQEFIDKFDAVGIPHCPENGKYKIERGSAETTIKITCTSNGEFAGHGDYHPES